MVTSEIQRFEILVTKFDEANAAFIRNHGQNEDTYMVAYSHAHKALEEWSLTLVLANQGRSGNEMADMLPPKVRTTFMHVLGVLETNGLIRKEDEVFSGRQGWFCSHPDVQPVPEDPHDGRCGQCGESGFPMTYEAAYGTPGPEDREILLKNALKAILECSTLQDAKAQAQGVLDATINENDF